MEIGSAVGGEGGDRDLVGLLLVGYRRRHVFTPTRRLAAETFASHAALALHNAVATVRAMSERRSEFERVYAALAHRLRNLLGPIPAALRLARDGGADPSELRPFYVDALDCALRGQRVVDDLERLTRSRTEPVKTRMPGAHLAEELRRRVERYVRPAHVRVKVQGAECLPELKASVDRIADAFDNFADDSIRHRMPRVALQVGLSFEPFLEDGTCALGLRPGMYLKISYTDNGPGVPNDKKVRVFDEFYKDSQGTGIGLSIARQDVASHGGLVRECGVYGEGVCFELFLRALGGTDDMTRRNDP